MKHLKRKFGLNPHSTPTKLLPTLEVIANWPGVRKVKTFDYHVAQNRPLKLTLIGRLGSTFKVRINGHGFVTKCLVIAREGMHDQVAANISKFNQV